MKLVYTGVQFNKSSLASTTYDFAGAPETRKWNREDSDAGPPTGDVGLPWHDPVGGRQTAGSTRTNSNLATLDFPSVNRVASGRDVQRVFTNSCMLSQLEMFSFRFVPRSKVLRRRLPG